MPNWCSGVVEVEGKTQDVEKFCRRFIFENNPSGKYFARSFINEDWKSFKKRMRLGKTRRVTFVVSFAWSCWSCLIEGYPQKNKDCITLKDACKLHKVKVKIDTEEEGIGFEEHVICDKKGILLYSSEDMPLYECENCEEKMVFPSDNNPNTEQEECYNCGKFKGWRSLK